jgi:protein TonB
VSEPHEIFGDVVVRPARPRARSVVAFSVLAHVAVLVAGVVVPLLAVGELPLPQRAASFFFGPDVMPVVPPPPPLRASSRPAAHAVPDSRAPTVAPTGIGSEVPITQLPGPGSVDGPPSIGAIDGIVSANIGVVQGVAPLPPVAPIRLHAGIRAPRRIVDVAPIYPPLAQASRKEGSVILEATIDARGNVEAINVLRSEPLLDDAAVAAVKQWKFTPTLLNGVPVPIIMTVTVRFTLR